MRKGLQIDDTIFSLSSGGLPCAVAIEKVSGPLAFVIVQKLFRSKLDTCHPLKRGMYFGNLLNQSGEFRDDILLLVFPNPNSHTGQDVVEFHCHGSRAIIDGLESDLLSLGARPAEKGEFTYRALLNGKTDPESVDQLGDLFLASRPTDLRQIYSRKDHSIAEDIDSVRVQLIKLRAILETSIDFSEEYSHVLSATHEPIRVAIRDCSLVIQRYSTLKSLGNEPKIVLAGAPNAGKSSLFNALLGRYRSIVREEPGTTRDVLEEVIELAGRPWRLVDTAGMRDAGHSVEAEGIQLAKEYLESASFWILVVDGTQGMGVYDNKLLEQFGDKPHLILWNKSDLPNYKGPAGQTIVESTTCDSKEVVRLAKTLEGRLTLLADTSSAAIPTAAECRRLQSLKLELEGLQLAIDQGELPEILAEQCLGILNRLEGVIGEVTLEDVLDRVFSEFCIGK